MYWLLLKNKVGIGKFVDTNQVECNLRTVKTQMKVSGVIRTERGAKAYVVICLFLNMAKSTVVTLWLPCAWHSQAEPEK